MLKQVKIENFKSVKKVDVNVGRFNVIIGENGAGKSNFLEALAVYSAIESEKFDHEFLWPRGIRYTEPKELISLFENTTNHFSIEITEENSFKKHKAIVNLSNDMNELSNDNIELVTTSVEKNQKVKVDHETTYQFEIPKSMLKMFEQKDNESKLDKEKINEDEKKFFLKTFFESLDDNTKKDLINNITQSLDKKNKPKILDRFLVYSPENTALKNLVKEGQILPLGINGEGLFKQIQRIKNEIISEIDNKEIDNKEIENKNIYKDSFKDIIDCATKFDWVDSIDVSESTNPLDHKITITDRYLIKELDQRSANEGFLFVLFYATLFCSKNTPRIFAIDNIDASLNPRMCEVLIATLIKFSKKYDKQVFVTTHNPAILDGLNLYDEEQALFVVSRNSKGHSKLKRLNRDNLPREILNNSEGLRLSEAFIRGYLGGLPKNF